jgi:hypothetical protein
VSPTVLGLCFGAAIVVVLSLVARHRQRGGYVSPWWAIGLTWVAISVVYIVSAFDQQPAKAMDFACQLPGRDSEFGSSTWQSWPPGTICYDLNGDVFSRPGVRVGVAIVVGSAVSGAFLVGGGIALARALRRRGANDPADRTARMAGTG